MMKSKIVTRTARQIEEISFTAKQDNSPSSQNSILPVVRRYSRE
jgi:hypothetical protein